MPTDYTALCQLHLPRPIRDGADYEAMMAMAEVFAGFEDAMTPEHDDYFDILCTLLEAWDKATVTWPKVTPLEMLKHLVQERGMSGADVSRLLGGSRHLGPMILRGQRSITAAHARKLAAHFGVGVELFV